MTEYAYEGPKRSSTTVTWAFATTTYAADSIAPFSNTIGALYQATIQAAFAVWSAVSGLTFTQVADSATAAIRIGFGIFASPYEIGETIVRSINGALPNDTVVRLLDPSIVALDATPSGWVYDSTDVTLYQVAVHEIGHALGLGHTTDPVTIMYPVATTSNEALAAGDIMGINGLYPLYTVTSADTMQVGGSAALTYHFTITRHNDLTYATTIRYQIVGAAYDALPGSVAATASDFVGGAYPSGTLTFAAGAASITLTVSVAANVSAIGDQGFTLALSGIVNTATTRGTTSAVILESTSAVTSGTLSIFRFFDTQTGAHFFTASASERNQVIQSRPDLTYEGVDLRALSQSNADPNTIPIYRFFDTHEGTHFYTASTGERDSVITGRPDLVYEGISFYEHGVAESGDTPVYRFFDTQSGTQFLTSSTDERASIIATRPDFTDEGVAFYAPA